MTLEDLSKHISNLDAKFDSREANVEDGFNASKIREDEILGVARLGLEAHETLRGEMNRRSDASDNKTDAQISLLESATGS
jgi:hypothetical protein